MRNTNLQHIEIEGPLSIIRSERPDNNLEKYQALISASNIGAWEYFSETGYLRCNDNYFSMLGRDINDHGLSGATNLKTAWIDLLHPDDKLTATRNFTEYLKTPSGTYESYFRMRHIDGSWKWIWSRGCLLKAVERNEPPVFIGTHVDITKHKDAEEAIQQERILLRTLIDTLPDAIYVKDVEARKVIANRADVASIGLSSEEEVLGKTDLDLFDNYIGQRGYEDDFRVLQTGNSIINREEYFLDATGSKRWLLTTKIAVKDDFGKVKQLLGIGHDITVRKQSEEELNTLNQELSLQSQMLSKQAEDLKTLNKQLEEQKEQELEKAIAQGKFEIASEVLHDIGNAMVGLGSHLNRINRIIEQNNTENIKKLAFFLKGQQNEIAGAIGDGKAGALIAITEGVAKTLTDNQDEARVSITELLNIITHIQEILNIQRQLVRGHTGVRERKQVNLINIIEDCRSMLSAAFDKKGILFKVNIDPGTYVIKGDHTKLVQVVLNILKNSIEAIDIDAREKKINIDLQNTPQEIKIIVSDSGQGFDAETSLRFFERGFTTKKSGTGLGLYNCKSIVESHAGSFEISSDGPGHGAVTLLKFVAGQ